MSISNGPNRFGFLKFVIVIYLLFAIWNFSPKPKSFFLDQLAAFQASGGTERVIPPGRETFEPISLQSFNPERGTVNL
jgi:hypothetical protein